MFLLLSFVLYSYDKFYKILKILNLNLQSKCFVIIDPTNSHFLFIFRDLVLGTTVALCVVSSSSQVDPSFKDHCKNTVIGIKLYFIFGIFH